MVNHKNEGHKKCKVYLISWVGCQREMKSTLHVRPPLISDQRLEAQPI